MVQVNGTREAPGTLLMIDFAWISWKVIPRNSGVSTVTGCPNRPGSWPSSDRASQRIPPP